VRAARDARYVRGERDAHENILEYRVRRPDGSVRHVQSIAAPLNREYHVAGVLRDVTARAQSEERERELQRQLRLSSHQAGMAEIATGVLHNVGNVLNSLGIANSTARRTLKGLQFSRLAQACGLLGSNRGALAAFLTEDARGRHLPDYLAALSAELAVQAAAVQGELDRVDELLHHMRKLVSAQQSMAQVGGLLESIDLRELVESALLVQASGLAHIEVVRSLEALPPVLTNRHKLLQILVNLVSNARDAVLANPDRKPRIVVRLARDGRDALLAIEDSGVGMSAQVLAGLWRFGFTTKPEGHGFGLHNSANAAREIGASIDAYSDGPGHGARFVLRMGLVAGRIDRAGAVP
jgi:signal transduction histidine kinase